MMQESDTYLMILEEGEEKAWREAVLGLGEARLGACSDENRSGLASVSDIARLKRMHRRALEARSWQEVLETP